MEFRTGRKRHVHIRVIMSENEEVDIIFLGELLGKPIQRLLHPSEHVLLMTRETVAS